MNQSCAWWNRAAAADIDGNMIETIHFATWVKVNLLVLSADEDMNILFVQIVICFLFRQSFVGLQIFLNKDCFCLTCAYMALSEQYAKQKKKINDLKTVVFNLCESPKGDGCCS